MQINASLELLPTQPLCTAQLLTISPARERIIRSRPVSVALSGGSTPRGVYASWLMPRLIRARNCLGKVLHFFGDERHVPPDHQIAIIGWRRITDIQGPVRQQNVTRFAELDAKKLSRIEDQRAVF